MFDIPILLIIFNRPDTTKLVFEKIREVKPKQLFIAADGPRKDKPFESKICEETRTIVLSSIDWDCEVKTLFREENLGCGRGVYSAITWFFDNIDKGIIIEDDCIASSDFFGYCRELLIKYEDNSEIFHISGTNLINRKQSVSFYGSKYPLVWGWATWKRAWKYYNFYPDDINEYVKSKQFAKQFKDINEQWYWIEVLNSKIDTWDIQWIYAIWKNNGISINPSVNLISNVGFDSNATHTKMKPKQYKSITKSIMPIKYPHRIQINSVMDYKYFYTFCIKRSIWFIIKSNMKYRIFRTIKGVFKHYT